MSAQPCGCDPGCGIEGYLCERHRNELAVANAERLLRDDAPGFTVKDSGARQEFAGGMVRDTAEGKIDYTRALDGPMFDRWAAHLSRAEAKYPDIAPGVPNWTLAAGDEEYQRFRKSAFRHFLQWFRGDVDEDHAAAVFFNVNGAEFVKGKR